MYIKQLHNLILKEMKITPSPVLVDKMDEINILINIQKVKNKKEKKEEIR